MEWSQHPPALIEACESGNFEAVYDIIHHNRVPSPFECGVDESDHGTTPLIIAAANGYLNIVKCLVEDGKVNVCERHRVSGETAFMLACENRHQHVVEYLAGLGVVDFNDRDLSGATALIHLASGCSRRPVTETEAETQRAILSMTRFLVEDCGVNVYFQTEDKEDALLTASMNFGSAMVFYLTRTAKVNVNVQDIRGETALFYVDDVDVAKCLVEEGGADVSIQDDDGETALSNCENPKVLDYLLRKVGPSSWVPQPYRGG